MDQGHPQISKSIRHWTYLPFSRYITIFNILLWKFRSRSRSTTLAWCHSMANVNLRHSRSTRFYAIFSVFEILTFQTFDLESLGQRSPDTTLTWRHSMANINLYMSHSPNFCADSYRLRNINISIVFDLEHLCDGHQVQRSQWCRWRMSTSLKVIASIFTLALTVFEILICKNVDLENVGQGHRIHRAQWRHSMANIKVAKRKSQSAYLC